MAQVTIKLRRDDTADWTSNNPTLALGEMGIETDTNRAKVGNGADQWNDLPYFPHQPKVYRAIVQQTLTGAPTAIVLENTFGATLVWSRQSGGVYKLSLTGAFTEDKTFVVPASGAFLDNLFVLKYVTVDLTSEDQLVVSILDDALSPGVDMDSQYFPFEVLVYP